MTLETFKSDVKSVMDEWRQSYTVRPGKIMIIGCSTSEIKGEAIGSAGSSDFAEILFKELKAFQQDTGVHIVFQCCEHLNRAIVLERSLQQTLGIPEVSAVPHAKAGGSMATYAYHHMDEPVLIESIQADLGMDIGDTLIGMHLKPVAVPIRFPIKTLGDAHVTYAYTRPKLIGGERAIYHA
ncbi:TIGR01440 family protein [Alkalibacillus salilacus]|uniref:UPF0340 protein J2S77_002601 n=1 Tax=Alkalibacillus salilacus TaxID=284582 RepID=A0ABT9VI11_9BACI|nr:TIGR01440 family protein [Alkalibacillus salilacus]MDQ0160597.1 uncharacterized protein (TIGR01440 family) [Alkalibacillus salilacus]